MFMFIMYHAIDLHIVWNKMYMKTSQEFYISYVYTIRSLKFEHGAYVHCWCIVHCWCYSLKFVLCRLRSVHNYIDAIKVQ
jgi:hypothetical protein